MQINVYISNISEDVWSFIDSMHDKEKKPEIDQNADLSDRELLTLARGVKNVAILPTLPDKDFLIYFQELFGITDLEILTPNLHSGEICRDIQNDKLLIERLKNLGKENIISITSYSATPQLSELIDYLRSSGIHVETPECPKEKDMWVVNYYGSKSGVRQTADQLQTRVKPWMGKGYIAQGSNDVSTIAASVYCKNGGVVLKTNKAHAGMGVRIFKKGDLPSEYKACREKLEQFLNEEMYWQIFPVVVETGLDVDVFVGGGNPNCEFYITPNNEVKLLYICGLRVSPEGMFRGVEIHKDIFPKEVLDELLLYGKDLGREYASAGYRGYFDVDCIYTKDKRLYIAESNVRRTGGTHVYHAAEKLFGTDFMNKTFILSNNVYPIPNSQNITFQKIHSRFKEILYSKEAKEGLVFASVNELKKNLFGYIIFGRNKERAHEIEEEMERLLKEYS